MVTINIDDEKILSKYSHYELKLKFINFLRQEIKNENIELFWVSISDLDPETKKAYDQSFQDVFIDY